jgi:hypothetical protein
LKDYILFDLWLSGSANGAKTLFMQWDKVAPQRDEPVRLVKGAMLTGDRCRKRMNNFTASPLRLVPRAVWYCQ